MNQKGFTLTEVMIVLVIIGVLATWSVPRFMTTISKAKLSEYKLTLEHAASLQDVYYHEHDSYGKTFSAIGCDAQSSKYFEYTIDADSSSFMIKATVKRSIQGVGGSDMNGKAVTINHKNEHGGDPELMELTGW
jgi:type IV pilus assembly protein PilE